MARITVEDCVDIIKNRFDLVLVAAKRARQLSSGAVESFVPWGNHKATVLALREIAAGYSFEEEEKTPEQRFAAELRAGEEAGSMHQTPESPFSETSM